MGNTWTVEVWRYSDLYEGYRDELFWQGESFFQALLQFRRAKKTGSGCIKLYWRPKTNIG